MNCCIILMEITILHLNTYTYKLVYYIDIGWELKLRRYCAVNEILIYAVILGLRLEFCGQVGRQRSGSGRMFCIKSNRPALKTATQQRSTSGALPSSGDRPCAPALIALHNLFFWRLENVLARDGANYFCYFW